LQHPGVTYCGISDDRRRRRGLLKATRVPCIRTTTVHHTEDPIMAEVQAFRGFRYDLARVGELSNVIAPPYDVIDAALQDHLYGKSPYNVIRLELNKESAADSDADNRYTRSANILRDWQRDGVLVQDSARSLYVYHQDFTVEGKTYTRKGVMARVRLEP